MMIAQSNVSPVTESRESRQGKTGIVKSIVPGVPVQKNPEHENAIVAFSPGKAGKSVFSSRGSSSAVWLGIDAGWGYRLGTVYEGKTPDMGRFSEKMRSGLGLTATLVWFFDEYFGVGAEYSLLRSVHNDRNLWVTPYTVAPDIAQKISIHYAGPEVIGRFRHHQEKNACWISLMFGYGIYRENTSALGETQKVKGGSFIANAAVGYDLGITRHLAIGLKIHWGNGRMYHYQMNMERDPMGKK